MLAPVLSLLYTDYRVGWVDVSSGVEVGAEESITETQYRIEGLTGCREYAITVTAMDRCRVGVDTTITVTTSEGGTFIY